MSNSIIALVTGCFDCFHDGHRHILDLAYKCSDRLVVAINDDEYIRKYKHREPINNEDIRMLQVWLYGCIDIHDCILFSDPSPLSLILEIKPDLIFAGSDYTLDKVVGYEEAKEWGGKVILVDRIPGWSTTEIIRKGF